jgi:exosortase A-associated hydrolase 2
MEPPISFFLPAPAGNLFAMYYPPAQTQADCGDVLYVHPFAGEMFAARTVISACARELAAAGRGVLTVDLHGCGDSSGDFSDARWEIWQGDLAAAVGWLKAQGRDCLTLWGLRMGALLALDFAVQSQADCEKIIVWQPVISGRKMLTQFFRMNLDEADKEKDLSRLTNPDARELLADKEIVEIAGYGLSPSLIRALDRQDLFPLGTGVTAPIHWVEFAETADRTFPAESLAAMESWKRSGVRVSSQMIESSPFWIFPHCCDPAPLTENLKSIVCADLTAIR